jgi:RNA polymerase sigma factor (sigma-70 family)
MGGMESCALTMQEIIISDAIRKKGLSIEKYSFVNENGVYTLYINTPRPMLPSFALFFRYSPKTLMATHPDQSYIEGLLDNDNQIVDQIYRLFSPAIRNWVMQNSGTEDDAADVFQESLIDIYNQARYKQLRLTCPFQPFLLLICKRKWLNEIKKRGGRQVTKSSDDLSEYGEDVFAAAERVGAEEEKARLFFQQFERLGEKCREIIRMSLAGHRQEKVAEILGVTYGYLRKKKSECMATLMAYVQAAAV